MKLKNYLLLGSATLFVAACSSSDDNNNQEMVLNRVEVYYPSKSEYENSEDQFMAFKEVQYYENGEIALDSFYDGYGNYHSGYIVQTTGNTKIMTYYDAANIVLFTTTYNYDTAGRLLEIIHLTVNDPLNNKIDKYSYEADGTIVHTFQHSSSEPQTSNIYTTNEAGLISGTINNDGTWRATLIFEDGNVPQINHSNGLSRYYKYYTTPKPSNLRMNTTQSNNYILEEGLDAVGNIAKYYLKAYDNADRTYESTFNESGYITHTNYEGNDGSARRKTETFYYYN